MSEPDDLLGKADAFLKRYRPTSSAARRDVPVLTEVIAEAPTAPAQAGPSAAPQETKTDFAELEQRLKQSILDAVASHVAKVIEEPLKSRLDAQLQRALVTVSAQVKADLEALIRDAVTRAVEAEIARARGPSRGG
jgi:hypothetical protein